jgi:hypothetical protein
MADRLQRLRAQIVAHRPNLWARTPDLQPETIPPSRIHPLEDAPLTICPYRALSTPAGLSCGALTYFATRPRVSAT